MFFTAFLNTIWAKSEWELSLWLHFIQTGHFRTLFQGNRAKSIKKTTTLPRMPFYNSLVPMMPQINTTTRHLNVTWMQHICNFVNIQTMFTHNYNHSGLFPAVHVQKWATESRILEQNISFLSFPFGILQNKESQMALFTSLFGI